MGKPALVIGGGGMRNAFISGVLLGATLSPRQFSAVFANSSGAGVAAFFVAGQIEHTRKMWIEELTGPELYSPRRMLRGRRPYNADYPVDYCCRELDIATLAASPTKLFVGVFHRRDGRTVYRSIDRENWKSVLKATGALPLLGRPVEFDDGQYYVDGGVEELFPLRHAYTAGYRRIMILSNRPLGFPDRSPGFLASFLAFPFWPAARRAMRKRTLENTWAFIASPPADAVLHVLAPSAALPAERLTRSPALVRKTFDLGYAIGREHKQCLHSFLS